MSTTSDAVTYGGLSNAPGRRDEDQSTNKAKSTAFRTDAVTTTTTTAASFGGAATAVGAGATVAAAETAIRTVRRARTYPTTMPTAKVTGTVTRKETGCVATINTLVGGTGYTNGTYTNVALSGDTGRGATANITVAGGIVTVATLNRGGQWYLVGDVLSCLLIGAGSTFSVTVATITQG